MMPFPRKRSERVELDIDPDAQVSGELCASNIMAMDAEWASWLHVVVALKLLGVDVNKEERLVNSIVLWGEKLVALRMTQPPSMIETALKMATESAELQDRKKGGRK